MGVFIEGTPIQVKVLLANRAASATRPYILLPTTKHFYTTRRECDATEWYIYKLISDPFDSKRSKIRVMILIISRLNP